MAAARRSTADLQALRARAARLIARRHRDPLTLDALAAALDTSPRRLQLAYRRTGASFAEEVRATRLATAAQLLAEQAIPVALIARISGYASPAAFTRAFVRRYGVAPAGYRAAARAARGARAGAPPSSLRTTAKARDW